MSRYQNIRLSEPNLTTHFKGFRVQHIGIKYYLTNSVSNFFWIWGKIWEKLGDIWWNIWLFGHPNPTIWNFKLSEPIRVRLFDIGRYLYPTFCYPLIIFEIISDFLVGNLLYIFSFPVENEKEGNHPLL